MNILTTGLGLVLSVSLLTGCTAQSSVVTAVANKFIEVPDGDMVARGLLAMGFAAVVSEIAADRVTQEEPWTAGETLARMDRLSRVMDELRASDDDWPKTALYEARLELYAVIGDGAKDRALGAVNGIPDLTALLASIKRGGKANGMFVDMQGQFDLYSAEIISAEELRAVLRKRFEKNRHRLRIIAETG